MDEEGVNSDPSGKSTRKSSDRIRDSQGHFVKQLAGTSRRDLTEKGNTNSNSISIRSNYENDCSRNMPMFSDAHYCYSLLEAMPMPGPVWSTTDPCILAEPLESVPAEAPTSEGSVELEWGENQASSYSWWIGFLESLDGNNMSSTEKVKSCPFVESIMVEDSRGFGYDSSFVVDATDQSCCLDDWLMIPTTEMDLEDMVVP
ncbi:hypothetical protein QN277_010695 [Acacia crassicarpa]|uniref:Uncharacterized protein n=1 Tax=Acacia crassicarpa TaxID=499986 RepID=A0AAE1MBB3_9FABA|nr:hypothetical protein QN277_010695 [Acacia crassicarpa]